LFSIYLEEVKLSDDFRARFYFHRQHTQRDIPKRIDSHPVLKQTVDCAGGCSFGNTKARRASNLNPIAADGLKKSPTACVMNT
jgi:hypothetical protein